MRRGGVVLLLVLVLLVGGIPVGCGPAKGTAEWHAEQGDKWWRQGRYDEGREKYTKAIRLNPKDVMSYNNRGFCYLNLGRYERAIEDFDEAIRLNPQYALAYAHRALAHTALGKDEEAERDAEEAVKLGFDPALLEMWVEEVKKER